MGGRAAVWLVLLVEDCCYSLQVAVLPPSLPLQPMRGPWWRVEPSVLHTCYPSPPILHPMMGLKNREEVGEVLAGWLAISGGQDLKIQSSTTARLTASKERRILLLFNISAFE